MVGGDHRAQEVKTHRFGTTVSQSLEAQVPFLNPAMRTSLLRVLPHCRFVTVITDMANCCLAWRREVVNRLAIGISACSSLFYLSHMSLHSSYCKSSQVVSILG